LRVSGVISIAQVFIPDSTEMPSLRFGKWESAVVELM